MGSSNSFKMSTFTTAEYQGRVFTGTCDDTNNNRKQEWSEVVTFRWAPATACQAKDVHLYGSKLITKKGHLPVHTTTDVTTITHENGQRSLHLGTRLRFQRQLASRPRAPSFTAREIKAGHLPVQWGSPYSAVAGIVPVLLAGPIERPLLCSRRNALIKFQAGLPRKKRLQFERAKSLTPFVVYSAVLQNRFRSNSDQFAPRTQVGLLLILLDQTPTSLAPESKIITAAKRFQ